MDEICSRFPHIAFNILTRLNCESLEKCTMSSRTLNTLITKKTNLWIMILFKTADSEWKIFTLPQKMEPFSEKY